jgi:hypothetical protein
MPGMRRWAHGTDVKAEGPQMNSNSIVTGAVGAPAVRGAPWWLAGVAAIGCLGWLLFTWGVNAFWVGVLVGLAGFVVYMDRHVGKQRWLQRVVRWGRWIGRHALVLLAFIGAVLISPLPGQNHTIELQDAVLQQGVFVVELLGLALVVVGPLVGAAVRTLWADDGLSPVARVDRLLNSLAVWWLVSLGVASLAYVVSRRDVVPHPSELVTMGIALILVWVMRQTDRGLQELRAARALRKARSVEAARVDQERRLTPRDRSYVAAHEAGHALVYAALGGLPAPWQLAIHTHADTSGILGFVSGFRSGNQLEDRTFAEWKMLVLLAGQAGELAMQGDTTLASADDHARWMKVAGAYLAHHHRGVFYARPQSQVEAMQNEVKMEALRREQEEILKAFFAANAPVHTGLAKALLARGTLTREQVVPFLQLVRFPDGFPLPFGEFDKFSYWPLRHERPSDEDDGDGEKAA